MYQIWVTYNTFKMLFPVTPEKIDIKVKSSNKTITLINEAEVNQIKGLKLQDISFDLLLPNQKYPFSQYVNGKYQPAKYYLEKLANLIRKKKPLALSIIRTKPNGSRLFDTVINVTIESYEIKESVDEGMDVVVSISFKTWKDYGTTAVKVKKKAEKVTYTKIKLSATKKKIVTSYTTKKGDNLHLIAKKVYGKYTKNNAKAIFDVNKKTKKQMDVVAAYLKKLNPKKKSFSKAQTQKLPNTRAYTAMTYPKGVKLTIPHNKK